MPEQPASIEQDNGDVADVQDPDGFWRQDVPPDPPKPRRPGKGHNQPPVALSEYDFAQTVFVEHGDLIRFVESHHNPRFWYEGDGWYGDVLAVGELRRRVRKTIETMIDVAAPAPGTRFTYRKEHLTASRVANSVRMLADEEGAMTRREDWDADAHLVGLPGGMVWNMEAGGTDYQEPGQLISMRLALVPEAGPTPLFDRFLDDATNGDVELMQDIIDAAGYSLFGHNVERVVFVLKGPTGAGKTVFLNILRELCGNYVVNSSSDIFEAGREDHKERIARLDGPRLLLVSEFKGKNWNSELLKTIAGNETIQARFMRENSFEFRPVCTPILAVNEPQMPGMSERDDAILARLTILPFEHSCPPEKRDPELLPKMVRQEGPAILHKLLDGGSRWLLYGFNWSGATRGAKARYAATADAIGEWLDESRVVQRDKPGATTAELYGAFKTWCLDNGRHAPTSRKFGRALDAHGFPAIKTTGGARLRAGLQL